MSFFLYEASFLHETFVLHNMRALNLLHSYCVIFLLVRCVFFLLQSSFCLKENAIQIIRNIVFHERTNYEIAVSPSDIIFTMASFLFKERLLQINCLIYFPNLNIQYVFMSLSTKSRCLYCHHIEFEREMLMKAICC